MQAKVSDQGAASSDKAFELFNLSKNDHLTESISVEARARLGKTIVVRRATCKKVLSLHGQREADKPLPPVRQRCFCKMLCTPSLTHFPAREFPLLL